MLTSTPWLSLVAANAMGLAAHGAPGPWERVTDILGFGFSVGDVKITVGSVLVAVLLLVGFVVVSLLLRRGLRRYAKRHTAFSSASLYAVERLVHYLLIVIGVLAALRVVGVPMAQMAVFAGALGVGLGFGLQAIFNNFLSGLILLFDRSLKIDDFVELESDVRGHVREIRIRFTRITTNDGIDVLVPNSEFVSGRVTNWTMHEIARRAHIEFRVALDSDVEAVQRAALEAAAEVPFTLAQEGPRAPTVWLDEFGESALECRLVVWLNAHATVRPGGTESAYKWALLEAMDRHGITVPYAQRTVRLVGRQDGDDGNGRSVSATMLGRNAKHRDRAHDNERLSATGNMKRQDQ